MKKNMIAMTSITYAMKAQNLLNRMNIFCAIERTPKNVGSGCGYSIRVREDLDVIIDILDRNRIPYKEAYQTN